MEKFLETELEQEYTSLLKIDYYAIVTFLNEKYGTVRKNYFTNSTYEFRTKEILRTWEGLCIHHIDEDKKPGLSNAQYAIEAPWEYQLASRLVYCNLLEHLILHIKIYEMTNNIWNDGPKLGIYGAKKLMRQIDEFYCGEVATTQGEWNLLKKIAHLRNEYLFIVDYAQKIGISYVPNTLTIPYSAPVAPRWTYSVHQSEKRSNHWVWLIPVLICAFIVFLVFLFGGF